ncbi:Alpha/beta hydrolase [Planctomycetales bacterium 10988]|nr:Alpha/beta hydrolase [Planctomycetales bacterium 10988]
MSPESQTTNPKAIPFSFPEFRSHLLLPGPHLQTIAGSWGQGPVLPEIEKHFLELSDGDQLILYDLCPPEWKPSRTSALLVHGLAGSHGSPYLKRICARLYQLGIRAWRLDLRGAGPGAEYATRPYHAGRSEDLWEAVRWITRRQPDSPLVVVGFSLGGNLLLKFLAEHSAKELVPVRRAMAVSPPVDLSHSVQNLNRWPQRIYDRYFVRILLSQIRRNNKVPFPEGDLVWKNPPRTLQEIDARYTAPLAGFLDEWDYYSQSSAAQGLAKIEIPTWMVSADDDPVVPASIFAELSYSEQVHVTLTRGGGHLGFLAANNSDECFRWMDGRVVDWIKNEF